MIALDLCLEVTFLFWTQGGVTGIKEAEIKVPNC